MTDVFRGMTAISPKSGENGREQDDSGKKGRFHPLNPEFGAKWPEKAFDFCFR
ncbi:MAG TPA: hypothetical protein IAB57_01300 [Candidatus Fimivivens faecavium]|nr:hypothetical protein [Candidatus Fimivivens faecavium]